MGHKNSNLEPLGGGGGRSDSRGRSASPSQQTKLSLPAEPVVEKAQPDSTIQENSEDPPAQQEQQVWPVNNLLNTYFFCLCKCVLNRNKLTCPKRPLKEKKPLSLYVGQSTPRSILKFRHAISMTLHSDDGVM